jgi:hypothetical protein
MLQNTCSMQTSKVALMVFVYFQSKLKDSMSELATILEHETMDFTSSPPSRSVQEDISEASADIPMRLHEPSESSDSLWENLHSLPL